MMKISKIALISFWTMALHMELAFGSTFNTSKVNVAFNEAIHQYSHIDRQIIYTFGDSLSDSGY
eukprot:Pgem_evm1s9623